MKLLSVAIPSYNSEAYMGKCIDSLLKGGEEMEILVVDDGSKDKTLEIAREYEAKYPGIVRAIHQENKGHGGAVNTGIQNATGVFFKVVDSDDWVDEASLHKILDHLRASVNSGETLDVLISNYVYEKVGEAHKKVIHYRNCLPIGRNFTWNETGHFRYGQYILMHSVIYRHELLKEAGLSLPEHTFYVDNIYVYYPLPKVKTMHYLDVDFYRYFIGREDQSVNEKVMIGRLDQQMRVNRIMYNAHNLYAVEPKKLRSYMFGYLEIVTVISTVFSYLEGTEKGLKAKKELWKFMKEQNPVMYRKIRRSFLGIMMNLPGKGGRAIVLFLYRFFRKIFKFN